MPKIPMVERQGVLATGGLGPRANVGAFTAPGQALAGLGKTASDIQVLLDEYLSSDTSSEMSSKETHKYGNNTRNKVDRAFQSLMGNEDGSTSY